MILAWFCMCGVSSIFGLGCLWLGLKLRWIKRLELWYDDQHVECEIEEWIVPGVL